MDITSIWGLGATYGSRLGPRGGHIWLYPRMSASSEVVDFSDFDPFLAILGGSSLS